MFENFYFTYSDTNIKYKGLGIFSSAREALPVRNENSDEIVIYIPSLIDNAAVWDKKKPYFSFYIIYICKIRSA